MAATFSIDIDADRSLVRIAMSGFFAANDIAAFSSAKRDALLKLRSRPNQHVTLVDVTAMDIQAQGSVAQFQDLIADPRAAARRMAFVVSKSLARIQAQRAAERRDARFFTSREEAESWLLDPTP